MNSFIESSDFDLRSEVSFYSILVIVGLIDDNWMLNFRMKFLHTSQRIFDFIELPLYYFARGNRIKMMYAGTIKIV